MIYLTFYVEYQNPNTKNQFNHQFIENIVTENIQKLYGDIGSLKFKIQIIGYSIELK